MNDNKGWCSASICIRSEELSAKKISELLNSNASRSFEKGTPVSSRNPASALRKKSLWTLESDLDEDLPLDAHIKVLLAFIEKRKDAFDTLSQYCNIELFCGYSSDYGQGSLVLEADILKRLTIIPLELVLDLYPKS